MERGGSSGNNIEVHTGAGQNCLRWGAVKDGGWNAASTGRSIGEVDGPLRVSARAEHQKTCQQKGLPKSNLPIKDECILLHIQPLHVAHSPHLRLAPIDAEVDEIFEWETPVVRLSEGDRAMPINVDPASAVTSSRRVNPAIFCFGECMKG